MDFEIATMQSMPQVYFSLVKGLLRRGKLTRRNMMRTRTEVNREARFPRRMGRGVLNASTSGCVLRRAASTLKNAIGPTSLRIETG
jgi:hypothetical protein